MAADLKGLIQESLGPLPRVCQEQVLLDLERARMTAEDARADAARMARRTRTLMNEARAIAMSSVITGGMTRRDLRDALIETSDAIGDAIRATNQHHVTDEESDIDEEEPDDTVMAADEMSDEEEGEDVALLDARPLITPRWREENSEEWDRLWNLNRTEECPVCHRRPDIWDGPMNSHVATRCTHWACVYCWERIAQRDMRCPVCGDDLSEWLRVSGH